MVPLVVIPLTLGRWEKSCRTAGGGQPGVWACFFFCEKYRKVVCFCGCWIHFGTCNNFCSTFWLLFQSCPSFKLGDLQIQERWSWKFKTGDFQSYQQKTRGFTPRKTNITISWKNNSFPLSYWFLGAYMELYHHHDLPTFHHLWTCHSSAEIGFFSFRSVSARFWRSGNWDCFQIVEAMKFNDIQ